MPATVATKVVNKTGTSGENETPLHQFTFGNMKNERMTVITKSPDKFNGMPAISFTDSEVEKLAEQFELALVGKFSYGVPKIFKVTNMLKEQKH